uniref:Uncharacterized protein n=1 Tax=Anguilla anguilla TaxID=7936 RepID=A0A0E9UV60_ANGAN
MRYTQPPGSEGFLVAPRRWQTAVWPFAVRLSFNYLQSSYSPLRDHHQPPGPQEPCSQRHLPS